MSFSHYGQLCTEVYDLTKPIGHSFSGDIDYYRNRLASCTGRILEAMVGSGRIFIPLLEAGLKIDGVDYSPDMLKSCRERCAARGLTPDLYEGDLLELSLPHKYEAIIIQGGSLLLIEQRTQSIQVLKSLYQQLQPGGRLILDTFLPDTDFQCGEYKGTSIFNLPDGDTITLESKLVEADLFNQYKVSWLKYEKWRNGSLVQTELQRFAIRWYGVEEFKLLLQSVGFSDIVVSANYQYGEAPSNAGQSFVYEAVRK